MLLGLLIFGSLSQKVSFSINFSFQIFKSELSAGIFLFDLVLNLLQQILLDLDNQPPFQIAFLTCAPVLKVVYNFNQMARRVFEQDVLNEVAPQPQIDFLKHIECLHSYLDFSFNLSVKFFFKIVFLCLFRLKLFFYLGKQVTCLLLGHFTCSHELFLSLEHLVTSRDECLNVNQHFLKFGESLS